MGANIIVNSGELFRFCSSNNATIQTTRKKEKKRGRFDRVIVARAGIRHPSELQPTNRRVKLIDLSDELVPYDTGSVSYTHLTLPTKA